MHHDKTVSADKDRWSLLVRDQRSGDSIYARYVNTACVVARTNVVGDVNSIIIFDRKHIISISIRVWTNSVHDSWNALTEQLNEIRKSSMSRLLCDNGDHIQQMQRSAFRQVSVMWARPLFPLFTTVSQHWTRQSIHFRNPLLSCDELPRVDLSHWKDYSQDTYDTAYQHIVNPQYKK